MSGIERLRPTGTEVYATTVRNFTLQARAQIAEVQDQSASADSLNQWYLDFCSDTGNRFGAILYMFAKSNTGFKRDFVLGKNVPFDKEKVYGPRCWEDNEIFYEIMQKRYRRRRGPIIGAELSMIRPTSVASLGKIEFIDNPSPELKVHWYRNPFASVILSGEGIREYGDLDVVGALDKAISAVETMPGIKSPHIEQ